MLSCYLMMNVCSQTICLLKKTIIISSLYTDLHLTEIEVFSSILYVWYQRAFKSERILQDENW